jgi:branched-chain amino acid aminotransferase
MTSPVVSINGELRGADGLHVSGLDRGVLLADGLFETMRGRNGRIFRIDRHLARLEAGLTAIGIPMPPALPEWTLTALAAAGHQDARVRLTITRGLGPPGLLPPNPVRPTVIIAVWPMADVAGPAPAPVSLHVASGRRNERAMSAGLKTLSYTDGVLALIEAQRHGADDALFLDTDGHCSETTSANLFAAAGDGLMTPPASCGALPGITRSVVFELAAALGIRCEERAFDLEDLLGASEAFVTNSTRGPVAVARVGDRAIGPGTSGELTRRLAEAYRLLVLRECP